MRVANARHQLQAVYTVYKSRCAHMHDSCIIIRCNYSGQEYFKVMSISNNVYNGTRCHAANHDVDAFIHAPGSAHTRLPVTSCHVQTSSCGYMKK